MRHQATLTSAVEAQRRRISARQIDRRLAERKRRIKRRLYGTTRPGSLLKHQIPIKTEHWDVSTSGYLEMDLVSHSGASVAGEFLHTLDCVDIQTTCVERQTVMGKSHQGIVQAMRVIEQQLPFALRGVDSDNGSEFIMTTCWLGAGTGRPGNRCSSHAHGRTRSTTTPRLSRKTARMKMGTGTARDCPIPGLSPFLGGSSPHFQSRQWSKTGR